MNLVRQVVSQLRSDGGNVDDIAAYLDVPARLVHAALAYYANFSAEVDADAAWAARIEADERARWERDRS